MWIIPKSLRSVYVPAQADLTSVSSWQCQVLSHSLMWSGKHSPAKSCLRAWQTKPWVRRLSGQMLPPSTANRFVDEWILSWEAIPVSHFPMQVNALANAIRATCGPTYAALLEKYSQCVASSRTLQATFDWAFPTYEETSERLAIELRQEYSARLKWVQAIDGNGCSSSLWPTARASEADHPGRQMANHSGQQGLTEAATNWPTPDAGVTTRTNQSMSPGAAVRPALAKMVQHWPSPTAHDGRRPSLDVHSKQGANLSREVAQWGTPTTRDFKDGACQDADVKENGLLGRQVTHWQTPKVATGDYCYSNGNHDKPVLNLEGQVKNWVTPMATDGLKTSAGKRKECDLSHQVQQTTMAGASGSGKAVLSPPFVEALMGWPIGMTASAPVEMVSFLSWQRTHSSLLRRRLELDGNP